MQLDDVPDTRARRARGHRTHADELLALADRAVPGLVRAAAARATSKSRDLGDGMLVVHVLVDCRDAMGANLVNTVAEAVADRLAELADGQVGLRILSNLCDRAACACAAACRRARSRPTTSTATRCATASCARRASPSSIRTAPRRTTRAS